MAAARTAIAKITNKNSARCHAGAPDGDHAPHPRAMRENGKSIGSKLQATDRETGHIAEAETAITGSAIPSARPSNYWAPKGPRSEAPHCSLPGGPRENGEGNVGRGCGARGAPNPSGHVRPTIRAIWTVVLHSDGGSSD